MLNFIERFAGVIKKLNDLFNYRVETNDEKNPSFVKTLGNQIMIYNLEGDFISRDFELDRLEFFIQHLENLKMHDLQLFKFYIKELRKQEQQDSYWGIRFEISIASSFISKGIKFIKQECPDFIVDNNLGVECSSIRIRKDSQKLNYDYKISAIINKKSQNIYNNQSTALYVDFTNIVYNLSLKQLVVDTKNIRSYTKQSLASTNFGSIILFANMHTQGRLEQNYLRIDNDNLDPSLKNFLDKYYAIEEYPVNGYGTTYEL
ncbi:hypothetical protein [Flavobacterium sp. UBA7663]|uniref:hypothetical protein n=1 Tax=Flavobacterium sp. UBA7663 TaxID=1946557 RepID=UPI0025C68DE0|nr:hypothetical protein [Flavobacterium sp. UBA7663]